MRITGEKLNFAINFYKQKYQIISMNRVFGIISTVLMLLILNIVLVQPVIGQKKKFTVVLDAGHGGKDPGAVGKISKEKDIVLNVVKNVGRLINDRMPDVNVIYTRKTDVFLPLEERAHIANENHADLFISIHVNAAKSGAAYGAETYTMGIAKTRSNLDVAMTENSVMLLEDNYQTKYRGFDPNSVESYIMFDLMMDKYLDKSVEFATNVQNQFKHYARRYDRGVRQAGFWVLHRSACPSVLIELGFLSNYAEELYLASDKGQAELSGSIYNAFVKLKKEHDKRQGYINAKDDELSSEQLKPQSRDTDKVQIKPVVEEKKQTLSESKKDEKLTEIRKDEKKADVKKEDLKSDVKSKETIVENKSEQNIKTAENQLPVYKIQIIASSTPLKDAAFKGLKVDSYQENGMIKYTTESVTDYNQILKLRKEVAKKFPEAFIIAFVNGKKIPVNDALKLKK
jgi:N-acetylmuramoyl-L-alanine amidase